MYCCCQKQGDVLDLKKRYTRNLLLILNVKTGQLKQAISLGPNVNTTEEEATGRLDTLHL